MVDPRTPVIVGVGQFTENIDDPSYRGMSAVDLAAEAVRAALTDTGAKADDVAKAVDVVVGLRQFEISAGMPVPLGKSNNYPRSVMQRVGAQPARSVIEPVGGQGPQKLVGQPVQLERTPSTIARAAPRRGEHSEEILGELGIGAEDLARMKSAGVY